MKYQNETSFHSADLRLKTQIIIYMSGRDIGFKTIFTKCAKQITIVSSGSHTVDISSVKFCTSDNFNGWPVII